MNLGDNTLFREQCYVGGQWIDGDAGKVRAIVNPATGERIGGTPEMGKEETGRAIAAAAEALPGWRALTAQARAVILRRWFNLIMDNKGRPGGPHDHGTGEAPRRGPG